MPPEPSLEPRIETDDSRSGYKPGVRKLGRHWQALLLDGATIAWSCDHPHPAWENAADCAETRRAYVVSAAATQPTGGSS